MRNFILAVIASTVSACSGSDLMAPPAHLAPADGVTTLRVPAPRFTSCSNSDTTRAHTGIVYKVGADSLGLPVGGNRPVACGLPTRPVLVQP